MKILIDMSHPVHVHLFKNYIWEMQKKGHTFLITARNKDVTLKLLDSYGFKYIKRPSYSGFMKFFGMFIIDWQLLRIARKFKPDVFLGEANPYIAQVGWLYGKPSYIFDDTEHAKTQMFFIKPFATKIFTPKCYKLNLGKKQVRYNSFKELAYLHPKYFRPDTKILKRLGLKKGEKFFVLRFVSWDASHDVGEKGVTDKKELITFLERYGRVFISSEKPLSSEFDKYRISEPQNMHSLLYYADLFIGEGASMASECAMLGTPAIYVNSLPLGYIDELNKEGLVYTILDQKKILKKVEELLKDKNLKKKFEKKRNMLLKDKMNLTEYMIKNVKIKVEL